MTSIYRGFTEAKRVASESDLKTAKIGAFLSCRKRSYSRPNVKKTHPISLRWPNETLYSLHAEMNVLLAMKKDDTPYQCFLYKQNKSGTVTNSRPCIKCLGMLITYGVKRIFYTINDNSYGMIIVNHHLVEKIFTISWSKIQRNTS